MIGREVVMRALLPIVAVLGSALAASAPGQAPAPAAQPSPSPAASPAPDETDPDPDSADVSITATVSYKTLKFDQVGTPRVDFTGQIATPQGTRQLKTVWHAERINLPRPVQPGVTYRDGSVRLTITTRFEDIARLFAEDEAAAPAPSPVPSPPPEER
jgi:hypothetical protein